MPDFDALRYPLRILWGGTRDDCEDVRAACYREWRHVRMRVERELRGDRYVLVIVGECNGELEKRIRKVLNLLATNKKELSDACAVSPEE